MAFYIPYFVGASMASYLTKHMYTYMSEEGEINLDESSNNNIKDNTFLKLSEEPIILESIPEDIEINENKEVIEPNKEVIEPKEEIIEPTTKEVIEEVIEPTTKEVIEKDIYRGNGTIEKANLETIIEEPETPVVQEIVYCSKCSLYLPKRCFSKNQFKKYSKVPTCKICTKLK